MKKLLTQSILLAGLLCSTPGGFAHHATTAYDYGKSVTLTGTIRKYEWTNPHCFLQVRVVNEQGVESEWPIEFGTISVSSRMGWSKDSVKPGDKISMIISPMKEGRPGGTLRQLTLPDGKVLYGVANDVKVDASGGPVFGRPPPGFPGAAQGPGAPQNSNP